MSSSSPVRSLQDVIGLASFFAHAVRHPLDFSCSVGPTLSELTAGFVGSTFQPDRDIPDLSGKVIFVTGGNTGLGKETIIQLAQHRPSRIYLAARNTTKAQDAIASIQRLLPYPADIRHIPLDLASFKSIRAAATQFHSETNRLDILVLNAGVMGSTSALLTEDGFEIHFGTNHIGHFLLTKLLLPTLRQTPDARVVTLTSLANQSSPSYETMTSTAALVSNGWVTRYAASKAANILFAAELARRNPEILSVSVHPGTVASDLYNTPREAGFFSRIGVAFVLNFLRGVRSGARNQIWAASVAGERLVNGGYYVPVGVRGVSRYQDDAEMARALWEWTEEEIALRS